MCARYATGYYMHVYVVCKCTHKGIRNANYSGIHGLCMVYMFVEVYAPFQVKHV